MNLENPEDQSSVSTNIEDKKLIEEKINSQNISPIKVEQNFPADDNGKKNIVVFVNLNPQTNSSYSPLSYSGLEPKLEDGIS